MGPSTGPVNPPQSQHNSIVKTTVVHSSDLSLNPNGTTLADFVTNLLKLAHKPSIPS